MPSFKSIFPFDQTEVAAYKIMSDAEIEKALAQSAKIFPHWSGKTFDQRSAILKNVAGLLMDRKQLLAKLITSEMGKITKREI